MSGLRRDEAIFCWPEDSWFARAEATRHTGLWLGKPFSGAVAASLSLREITQHHEIHGSVGKHSEVGDFSRIFEGTIM